jgi:hypothetical protein
MFVRPPTLCRIALATLCLCVAASCASDESALEQKRKLREKNERYEERQTKRKDRVRARQKRVDMWYDSLMN